VKCLQQKKKKQKISFGIPSTEPSSIRIAEDELLLNSSKMD
jgi:hypothetical protein